MNNVKSEESSDKFRTEGNEFYSQRKFFDALLKYNESLCFAPEENECCGLAYANKSAVYLEMKLYENCIRNIELAKENNYPEKSFELLNKRQQKCEEMMKMSKEKASDPWSVFKLSYPPNKNFPYIADCLEVESNEKYGRYVIANRQLKVGDIIAIEQPFCSVLIEKSTFHQQPESNIYQRCTHCLKENALDLIPCKNCCKAMFCSTDCQSKAMQRFHQYECAIMDQLLKSSVVHMTLRQFFLALSIFEGSIEKLKDFIEENEHRNITVFDFDFRSQDSDKNCLLASRSLIRTKRVFSMNKHEEILKSHPVLKDLLSNHFQFVSSFLLWQRQISDLNYLGVFSGSSKKVDSFDMWEVLNSLQQPIGIGSLLFGSFINHSCSNNVFRVCVEGRLVYTVCRPIPRGSQIFDSYKTSFMSERKAERQERLLKEFEFMCSCEACSQNFQTPPALASKDAKLFKFAKKVNEDIFKLQNGAILKTLRNCCENMERHNKNFPSVELCVLQKCMVTCAVKLAQPSTVFP